MQKSLAPVLRLIIIAYIASLGCMTLCAQGRDYVPQTFEALNAPQHHARDPLTYIIWAAATFLLFYVAIFTVAGLNYLFKKLSRRTQLVLKVMCYISLWCIGFYFLRFFSH